MVSFFLVTQTARETIASAAVNFDFVLFDIVVIVNGKDLIYEFESIFSFLIDKQRGKHNIEIVWFLVAPGDCLGYKVWILCP